MRQLMHRVSEQPAVPVVRTATAKFTAPGDRTLARAVAPAGRDSGTFCAKSIRYR
jgi:hypothetical protein